MGESAESLAQLWPLLGDEHEVGVFLVLRRLERDIRDLQNDAFESSDARDSKIDLRVGSIFVDAELCRHAVRQDRRHGLLSVMTVPIKFGTDGWRAIIADTFTFENVRYAAQATADYFKTIEGPERAVFVGFDVGLFVAGLRDFLRTIFAWRGGSVCS